MVSDADLQREKMKIDISALLGGDVYAMLRARSEKRQEPFFQGARFGQGARPSARNAW